MSNLYVVGTGPGSREYLTLRALEIVKEAEVLVGSKRALDLFPEFEGEKVSMGPKNVDKVLELAMELVGKDYVVVILSTGDPGFSGLLKPLLRLYPLMDVEVVPGISALQLCASRLKLPWDSTDLVTLHGKSLPPHIMDVLTNGRPTILLPDFRVETLAQFLLDEGLDPGTKVAVCERLSYPDEKIIRTTLNDLASKEFSYMCVMVVY